MDVIVYLAILSGHFVYRLLYDVYAWLWKPATAFTAIVIAYVLFQVISILIEKLEDDIETSAIDTRLILQGQLLAMEGRLKAIESKLDRIERSLDNQNPAR